MNPAVSRSRGIRELLLRVLYNTFQSTPNIAVLAGHLYGLMSGSFTPYAREEIDAEIVDLINDGLITVTDAPSIGPMPDKAYRITSRGRDFYRAGCPWAHVDEYTGGQQ